MCGKWCISNWDPTTDKDPARAFRPSHTRCAFFQANKLHKEHIFEQLIGQKCFHTGVFIVWIKVFFLGLSSCKATTSLITMVVKRRMARLNTAPISTLVTDKGIICVFQHQVLVDKQDAKL